MANKCIFLDRDGVINKDRVNYAYELENFHILDGVIEALKKLHAAGYKLVIITNQSGIAKGIYTREQMNTCHRYLQEQCGGIIDAIYYAPYHESVTASLTRKPDSLMLEKGIAKFKADIPNSYMLGDKERDLIPAKKLGLPTILIAEESIEGVGDHHFTSLLEATDQLILS